MILFNNMKNCVLKFAVGALAAACSFVLFAGPEQDFDAAVKAGKPLTAEVAYKKLVQANAKVAPIVHYRAASIAGYLGKPTQRRDRLMVYLRTEKGWPAEKRAAAWELSRLTLDAEPYLALLKGEQPSPQLREEGVRLVGAFRQAKRPAEVLKVADGYLEKFKDAADRKRVILPLLEMSWEGQPNYTVQQAAAYLEKYPLADGGWYFMDRQSSYCNPKWRVDYMAKNKVLLPSGHMWWAFQNLYGCFLDKDRKCDEKAFGEYAKKALSVEPLMAKSEDFDMRVTRAYANLWFRGQLPFAADSNKVAQLGFTMISDIAALAKTPQQKGRVTTLISDWCSTKGAMTPQVGAQIQAKFESFYSAGMKVGWIAVPQSAAQKNSVAPFMALLKRYPDDWDLKWESQGHLCSRGEIAESTKYMVDYALREPSGRGDTWLNWLESYPTNALPVAKKAELLLKTAQAAGSTPMVKWMVDEKQTKRWKKNLFGFKEFDPVVAKIRAGIKTPSRLYELRMEIQGLKRLAGNKCPPRALEIAAEAIKLYPGRWPDKARSADDTRDFGIILSHCYWEFCRWENDAPAKLAKMLTGHVWKGFGEQWAEEMLRNAGKSLSSADRTAFTADYVSTNPERVGWYFGDNYAFASNTAALPKPFALKDLSAANLYWLVRNKTKDLAPAFLAQAYAEFYGPRFDLTKDVADLPWNWNWRWDMLCWLDASPVMKDPALAKTLPWDNMYKALVCTGCGKDVEILLLRLAKRGGRADLLGKYLAQLKTGDRQTRLNRLAAVVADDLLTPVADGKNLAKEKDGYWSVFQNEFLAMLKSIRSDEAPLFALPGDGNSVDRIWRILVYIDLWKEDKDKQAVFADYKREYVRLREAGLTGGTLVGNCYMSVLGEMLKAEKTPANLAAIASGAGRCYDNYCGTQWANDHIKALKEKEQWEALYLFVIGLQGNGWADQGLKTAAGKLRATISTKVPGIYPVSERDPAYPLYVAADEYQQNNPEKAWELLQKNLQVFERVAVDLPQDFTAWALEQLRLDRGAKDKNLLKAKELATALLEQESKITPELAAALLLTRAECYRDQQNFEAAKLEYQSIRDNPAYHATKYGKKAMFRAVDLQIETGNVQPVEQTLEYWQSQNDREIQAQAHYFLAKIAFARKDYDECIKQLKQVFAIDFTHTEGRFLQGQWKLATNNEVDDTEVLIGQLSERSTIRPGNQLTISVQDANLSVAGGGASIPVVVTTVPGGDTELVNLYQSVRDPSNFKGTIDVELGKAVVSNRVLQVRGDDTVSYVIEPSFLKARGLPLNEPKVMKVVDDAKVAMGAGAPRTDEKSTEKGVRDMLSGGVDEGTVSRRLRPGNPLYVVVQDRDRSMGGESDSVRVDITTSSGDRLTGFELREEKPFSGIFRGRIDTALPPPRAFASDTATGMNPGDVINSNKTMGWKSLSDGAPGKWFEVDTMGSHLFSNVTLRTSSEPDIKAIRLFGTMGGKTTLLGQLPKADEKAKLYLRRQQAYGSFRTLESMRAFMQTDKAPKAGVVSNVSFRVMDKGNRRQAQYAYYSGPFVMPAGLDSLRFRIVPLSAGKDALRQATVYLAIDGDQVFTGSGWKLQNALTAVELAPGCHRFELGVLGLHENDNFDFVWESGSADPQPLPPEWFDIAKNPQLGEFVKDLVTIVRTNDGFAATFEKPVRLRSVRWQFADVRSPDVRVERLTATDSAGKAILPVESDFSDSQNNTTLEVAPGDVITVKYEDARTSSGQKKTLQRQMASSFNDASVRFIFEEVGDKGRVEAFDAFRYQPGDALVICVTDPDCDLTDDPDTVEVKIENLEGQTFRKRLTEYRPRWINTRPEDEEMGMHSGIFMGVLKTCRASETNAPANVLRTYPNDRLTLTYEDRENTNPGVPCTRTAKISAVKAAKPEFTLFNARTERVVDKSADAKVKLERIRRRAGNENVDTVYSEVLVAEPMDRSASDTTNAIPVNVAEAIPLRVNDRSRARYAGSKIMVEAVARSERELAEAEGRDPDKVKVPLALGGSLAPYRLRRGEQTVKEAQSAGTFNGVIGLSLGPVDPNIERPEDAPPLLVVTGSDEIDVTVLSEEGEPLEKRTLKLVSDGKIGLTDSTYGAERNSAHVGETFFVMVNDADRDATAEPDRLEIEAISSQTGVKRPVVLTETMPHSGVFTGTLRPVMFAPGEEISAVSTGGVVTAEEALKDDRFAIKYGDSVIFRYVDPLVLPGTTNNTLTATGVVFRGSNGDVRLFSKRFADRDAAVLVQFRLAECLFEQAKEHRKLKQPEKSAQAIAEGKFILEEALKNYPDSAHVVQGEYLLANLYQELATEAKDAKDMQKAVPLYQEALSRFSQILGTWPEGEYAARSQYHKAYCLEMLQDYGRAAEEYVKMTYLYPESELVGDATIRLATYYYTKEKRFDIAGHIYRNFQQRFPQHDKAPRALFMAGSCYIKQAESIAAVIKADIEKSGRKVRPQDLENAIAAKAGVYYRDASRTFETLIEQYADAPAVLRAQTMYWAGDVCVRCKDYSKAYRQLKRTVFEYPETEWARRARGLLLQEGRNFKDFD